MVTHCTNPCGCGECKIVHVPGCSCDAVWLARVPREIPEEKVACSHDPYIPHHHRAYFEESRH